MARTARSERVMLKIKVQFEPSRLSDQCLATAYEVALPLISQAINDKRKRQFVQDGNESEIELVVKHG